MISEKKNITRRTFLYRGTCMHQKSQRGIQKILSVLKLPLCRLVVFPDMNMYILIEEDRVFKIFLKENYAIALDSCFLFNLLKTS